MNTFSWTQRWIGIRHLSPEDRIKEIESTLRDFNIGTQHLKFKITSIKKGKDDFYSIKLNASNEAVKRITSVWSEGNTYTLNGKRRTT